MDLPVVVAIIGGAIAVLGGLTAAIVALIYKNKKEK